MVSKSPTIHIPPGHILQVFSTSESNIQEPRDCKNTHLPVIVVTEVFFLAIVRVLCSCSALRLLILKEGERAKKKKGFANMLSEVPTLSALRFSYSMPLAIIRGFLSSDRYKKKAVSGKQR